jgi:predicted N-acetyltransferase YhbS
VFPVLAFTAFALLMARVVRAPAGTAAWIVGAAAAVLAASQLLPEGNPWRADVAGSSRTLLWIGAGLAPVVAYAVVLRGLRQRLGTDAALAAGRPHPTGLVRIVDDDALAAVSRAALDADADLARGGARLSLGWRGTAGDLCGHVRLRTGPGIAEIEMIRVEPGARRGGVGGALLRAAEGEARAAGASRIGALVGDWQAPDFFARAGYAEAGGHALGVERRRAWMEKSL